MDKKFLSVITAAVLIEAVITYANTFFVEGIIYWQMVASLVIGITVAVAYKVDIPSLFDMKSDVPYVGNILSGILISRGSNYLFDLLTKTTAT